MICSKYAGAVALLGAIFLLAIFSEDGALTRNGRLAGHGAFAFAADSVAPPTPNEERNLLPSTIDGESHGSGTVALPFGVEKLVYEVRYLGMVAGKAMLAVLEPMMLNGRSVYPLLSTLQSSDFVSMVYPINDRIESYFDMKGLYSHRLEVKQHEGKRRREKRIDFNQDAHQAVQVKNNERAVFDIPPRVNDFLSAIYYFRAQKEMEIGRSVFVDVHEGGKNWKLEMRLLGKETVKTPLGTFDTIKMQAMPSYEGLFLSKNDLFIWMTDDDRKIPVKIASKITVGTITLTLSSKREG